MRDKRALLLLAEDVEEKEMLLRSSLFDFEELIKSKDLSNISGTLSILTDNKDILQNLDIKSIISIEDLIPENLRSLLWENFDDMKSLLNINIEDITVPNVGEIKDIAEEKIADGLDNIFNLINN